jgi:hypothetical protein
MEYKEVELEVLKGSGMCGQARGPKRHFDDTVHIAEETKAERPRKESRMSYESKGKRLNGQGKGFKGKGFDGNGKGFSGKSFSGKGFGGKGFDDFGKSPISKGLIDNYEDTKAYGDRLKWGTQAKVRRRAAREIDASQRYMKTMRKLSSRASNQKFQMRNARSTSKILRKSDRMTTIITIPDEKNAEDPK